jgi:hypothetical protein
LLAEPPLSEAGVRLDENAARLASWDHDFQGRRAGRLRAMARHQIVEKARDYHRESGLDLPDLPAHPARWVVTGHQPELFHPGVWVKNFAVDAIARAHGAIGLNVVVDNDIPKSAAIRVPRRDRGRLRVERIEFDQWAREVPFEDLAVKDEDCFATFSHRVREALDGLVDDPVIDEFWPQALARREPPDRLGFRFARARRAIEGSWGVQNWEVPLSALCETEAFLWFAAHLLAQLPRFQAIHNAALARFRATYGIRSRHHPVPALGREGDWREAPFWVWHPDHPRRRPLMVRQLPRTMQLRQGGEDEPFLEIPLAPDREACCAVEQLLTLRTRCLRLRTRALTTTMFARFLIGDLFLHGIGGAKYDELGDEITHEFFGISPPAYLTLSTTLWLTREGDPARPERLVALERTLRDLSFNPDRHLAEPALPEARSWVEAKHAAIAGPVATHRQRIDRFRAIRRANEALQPHVAGEVAQLHAERDRLLAGLRQNVVAHSREYAFVLHSTHRLREVMTGMGAAIAQSGKNL